MVKYIPRCFLPYFLLSFILMLLALTHYYMSYNIKPNEAPEFFRLLEEEVPKGHVESYDYCFENAKSSTLPPREKWHITPSLCQNHVNTILVVKSSMDRSDNRRIIRKTWGKAVQVDIDGIVLSTRTIFVIGLSSRRSTFPLNPYLQVESRKCNDILQVDVEDGYIVHNVLRKTLNGLWFVEESCPRVKMIWIVDDDTIMAPWLLFSKVVPISEMISKPDNLFFGGLPFRMSFVPREISDTVRVPFPRNQYPCFSVPMYLQAFALLISRGTMKILLQEINGYYSTFFAEDIYLSWLAYRSNMTFHEFSKDYFDGSCLADDVSSNISNLHEQHAKRDVVEQIAVIHQCDSAELQLNLWLKLCQSYLLNDTTVVKIHLSYCTEWIEKILETPL